MVMWYKYCPVLKVSSYLASWILSWHWWQQIMGWHLIRLIQLSWWQNTSNTQSHHDRNFVDFSNIVAFHFLKTTHWNALFDYGKLVCWVFHISSIFNSNQRNLIFDLIIDFRTFFLFLSSLQRIKVKYITPQIWCLFIKYWGSEQICLVAERNLLPFYPHVLVVSRLQLHRWLAVYRLRSNRCMGLGKSPWYLW